MICTTPFEWASLGLALLCLLFTRWVRRNE